jgi:hypothetical protein
LDKFRQEMSKRQLSSGKGDDSSVATNGLKEGEEGQGDEGKKEMKEMDFDVDDVVPAPKSPAPSATAPAASSSGTGLSNGTRAPAEIMVE